MPAESSVTKTTDADLASAPLSTSLRLYPSRLERAAMRSGMMDAAALCDLIAAEVGRGRPSKRRAELAAVAARCGDAIEAMRERVGVPRE